MQICMLMRHGESGAGQVRSIAKHCSCRRGILRASWAQEVYCALSNVKPPALWACGVQLYWLGVCILTLMTDGSLLTSGC